MLVHAEWISLGLAIFFGLALLAEIYLACCVPEPEDPTDPRRFKPRAQTGPDTKQHVTRGWQAGSSSKLTSVHLSRP